MRRGALVCLLLAVFFACGPEAPTPMNQQTNQEGDLHSYSNPDQVAVSHIALDLNVDFERHILNGSATLEFRRTQGDGPIVLDTRALDIRKAEISSDGAAFNETSFRVGAADSVLGAPLEITAPASQGFVRVHYGTTDGATALQWLEPAQTAGKRSPFLYTQSQAIHARSWIPLQDTPGAKTTYSARIRTPASLRAVMSAGNRPDDPLDGDYSFEMPNPVPSYLIALAVGDLDFRPIGSRTGVFAEGPVVERAAKEFEDTETMLEASETLFGRYRWGRYDILVLPPSFPFGGMENPRLTFATPTVLAGDKSLVALIAHEMAHSWAGNLVTNATWRDFWLNEGWTVYLERRILEVVYGPERAAMEAGLGRQTLQEELDRLPEADEILYIDLKGRDPDDGFTEVPYEKGALFLRTIEAVYGRERFDTFLRGYFERFEFKSLTTPRFIEDLQLHLLNNGTTARSVPVNEWIYEPGIPEGAWEPQSDAFERVREQARPWLDGSAPAASIETVEWTTHEWLHFLKLLPDNVEASRLAELDAAFAITETGNSEILCQWLLLSIKNGYEAVYPWLEEFLTSQGRRKFLSPLYEELAKSEAGRKRALDIYRKARPMYHPIAVAAIDQKLGWEEW